MLWTRYDYSQKLWFSALPGFLPPAALGVFFQHQEPRRLADGPFRVRDPTSFVRAGLSGSVVVEQEDLARAGKIRVQSVFIRVPLASRVFFYASWADGITISIYNSVWLLFELDVHRWTFVLNFNFIFSITSGSGQSEFYFSTCTKPCPLVAIW